MQDSERVSRLRPISTMSAAVRGCDFVHYSGLSRNQMAVSTQGTTLCGHLELDSLDSPSCLVDGWRWCTATIEGVEQSDIDVLEGAVQALNQRELDPFVDLMADDMVWKGQSSRWLWWRQTPS